MEFNHFDNKPIINEYLNESIVLKTLSSIIKFSDNKLRTLLKDAFNKFSNLLIDKGLENEFLSIINGQFKTNYKSLKQLQSIRESNELNEDWKNFLNFWRGETYPALSIFPTLQIWFQIDKLIDGAGIMDLDWKKIGIYAVLWIIIITGQHAILWNKWRKENPDQYEKEGKPGLFRRGKV